MEKEPLVSICTTFWNAGAYVHRLIQSSINQTYRNIELVLVDEVSDDATREIVEGYARRDARVRYIRLDEKIGATECLKKAFTYARGTYVMFPGSDDWLAQDFIARGVKSFEEHPDAAGIVPKIIALRDKGNDTFEYYDEMRVPSGVYSREWFAERLYKSTIGVASVMALVRREDAVKFMDDFLENYCYNASLPKSLREMCQRLFGTDMLFFLEILRGYKTFVWDDSLVLLKIIQPHNITFNTLNRDSMAGLLTSYHYHLTCYAYAYKRDYPRLCSRMKIEFAGEALATAFIYFVRSGFRPSLFNAREIRKSVIEIFGNLSFLETAAAVALLPFRIIQRALVFVLRSVLRRPISEKKLTEIFQRERFLNAEGKFAA